MKSRYMKNKAAFTEMVAGYALVAPAVILFLLLGVSSLVLSIGLVFYSLHQGTTLQHARFVGLDNFRDFLFGRDSILSDAYWISIRHNIIIAVTLVITVIPLALLLAVLLQYIKKGVRLLRTVFLLPMVTSSVAVYYVWTAIYEPSGSINQILSALGLDNLVAVNGWLGELNTALPAIMITIIWGSVPGTMILYFAGLQTIDTHLYEAAEIDGASAWHKLLHITWPILRPITVIAVILTLTGAFQVFDQIWVMTKGGPASATEVVNVLVYSQAFAGNIGGDMGTANAMGWSMFIILFGLSLFSMRALRDKT